MGEEPTFVANPKKVNAIKRKKKMWTLRLIHKLEPKVYDTLSQKFHGGKKF